MFWGWRGNLTSRPGNLERRTTTVKTHAMALDIFNMITGNTKTLGSGATGHPTSALGSGQTSIGGASSSLTSG